MNFVIWMLVGALLGWAASAFIVIRDRRGITLNVVVGIAAVMLWGSLLSGLIGSSSFNQGELSLASLLVSLLGAAAVLAGVQLFDGAVRGPVHTHRFQGERTDMNKTSVKGRALRPLITAGLTGVLMLVGACASAPLVPQSALDGARVAISNAEKAEAGQFAGAELGEAREKLSMADNAVREENMVEAERFAQESQVQAELASARTAAAKAASVNEEMKRDADALTEEMERTGEPR
jgi:uncharacterized membrane protein YeaQ/YmgE (transglycosylase-associated protein family)